HPSEVDATIDQISRNPSPAMDLWITDVTWRESRTEERFKFLVEKGWRVFWVDHHVIALEKTEPEIRALGLNGWVASKRHSAARLLYDFLMTSADRPGPAPLRLKQFKKAVLLADDNDRWIHRRKGSRELALTVASMEAGDAYRELMAVGPSLRYSPAMQSAFESARNRLAESIALAGRTLRERTRGALTIVSALCLGYTSEVADALRRKIQPADKPAVIVLYNLEDQRVSLRRTPSCTLDLAKLAGRFGGGGHEAASGCDLPEARGKLQEYLLDRISDALEG
ncbi:MAG TPA: DHHA1 domain-containing protein, partial [Nitrospiria bacterium]